MVCGFGIEEPQPAFRTPFESIMDMFILSMGEFADLYAELDNVEYGFLGKVYK